jgi:hypothetical protein
VTPTYKTLNEVEARRPISTLPFTITQPGSYYLTGNFTTVGSENGITVSNSYVTIDLNGFTIRGSGTGNGVGISAQGVTFLTVKNGTITDFGYQGINTSGAGRSHLENVTVESCGGTGIVTGSASTLLNCHSSFNGSWGITCNDVCRVVNCSANNNGSVSTDGGIYAAPRSIITGCTASYNTGVGIWATIDTFATGCKADYNIGYGIQASNKSVVERSVCTNNTLAGIYADHDVTIRRNTCSANGVDGIHAGSYSTITANSCHANGPVVGGSGIRLVGERSYLDSNDLTGNYCGIQAPVGTAWNILTRNTTYGNNLYLDVAGANVVAPVLISPSNNGWFDVNPWANIAF